MGWLDGEDLYLDMGASLAATHAVGRPPAMASPITLKTLIRRLHERHFLASVDDDRGELQVRRTLERSRRRGCICSRPPSCQTNLLLPPYPIRPIRPGRSRVRRYSVGLHGRMGGLGGRILPTPKNPPRKSAQNRRHSVAMGGMVGLGGLSRGGTGVGKTTMRTPPRSRTTSPMRGAGRVAATAGVGGAVLRQRADLLGGRHDLGGVLMRASILHAIEAAGIRLTSMATSTGRGATRGRPRPVPHRDCPAQAGSPPRTAATRNRGRHHPEPE